MAGQRLQILQVNTADLGGGAEGSAWNLNRAYRDRGHQSWLAVGSKRSTNPDVLVIPNHRYQHLWARLWLVIGRQEEKLIGKVRGAVRLRQLLGHIAEPSRWLKWQRGLEDFDFPGTWDLLKLTPQPLDVVHCHNLHGGYFDLRSLPWLSHQVPVTLNLRDAWLLSGHCAHSLDCERWRIGCGQCPYLEIHPSMKRDATAHNWQRKRDIYQQSWLYLTAPSQWLIERVKASMLTGRQYRVIPNAIDLTIFQPGSQTEARQRLALPERVKIVLLIAHNPFKDYATMETALYRLQLRGNELIFICLGKLAKAKPVGYGTMLYRGMERDPHRMALYYQSADVFIHAAKAEAFGKTVVEAMACGTPVVATAVGGIPEQIDHGRTGFLTPAGDSQAMAAAIERLLNDPDLGRSMGQAAATEAKRRFGLDRQAAAFLAWYEEIIADWRQYDLPARWQQDPVSVSV